MNINTEWHPIETCETIKLSADGHAKLFYVGRQVAGATPQPVQMMTLEEGQNSLTSFFFCYLIWLFDFYVVR